MPELPEVETTRRGITPHLTHQTITKVITRHAQLRWPIPTNLTVELKAKTILEVTRRGKYLLLHFSHGTLIIHLGMSGSLRIVSSKTEVGKHDHFDLMLTNGNVLRFTDPRRFGCILWTNDDPALHVLMQKLGPEPLSSSFNAHYLYEHSRNRKVAIKTFIMNSSVVVGVGNIYANEALFRAGIHPKRSAQIITKDQYLKLVTAIKTVLKEAIKVGGTTLRNFVASDGKPGYFKQQLEVYGRAKLACRKCHTKLREIRIAQRSTVYCPKCQPL